jgi:DNA-binding LytR/AlgR family response regulator
VDFLKLVGAFEDAPQVYQVLNELDIDLIFLDIEMPGLSGIDFLRSLKNPPLVIFITAYPDFALQGYELDVIDYLVKPVPLSRFLKAVNKAKDILMARHGQHSSRTETTDYFFVKENGKYVRILYDEVLFVEAMQNYVAIHLPGRKLISYITLSILENQFPAAKFLRVHKSYIISLDKVSSLEGSTVIIQSAKIPVSRKVKDILMQRLIANKLLKR